MKRFALLAVLAICATPCVAQQPTVELGESLINRVITSLGRMQRSGVSQPFSVHQSSPLFEVCMPMGALTCPVLGEPPPGFGSNQVSLVACKTYGGGYRMVPAGDAVAWQWWISNSYVTLAQNSMKFTATVVLRVGGEWSQVSRTVDANVRFDTASNRLRLEIADFKVPVETRNPTARVADPVDVAKLFAVALELRPHVFTVRLPNGGTRPFNARITGASAAYSTNLVKVTLTVAP